MSRNDKPGTATRCVLNFAPGCPSLENLSSVEAEVENTYITKLGPLFRSLQNIVGKEPILSAFNQPDE